MIIIIQKKNDPKNKRQYFDCYNKSGDGYYLDIKNEIYRQCFHTCKTCDSGGNDKIHNCIECNIIFSKKVKINNYSNCYENCNNYYYFDNESNFHCTINLTCPEEYPQLVENNKECIKSNNNNIIYTTINTNIQTTINSLSYEFRENIKSTINTQNLEISETLDTTKNSLNLGTNEKLETTINSLNSEKSENVKTTINILNPETTMKVFDYKTDKTIDTIINTLNNEADKTIDTTINSLENFTIKTEISDEIEIKCDDDILKNIENKFILGNYNTTNLDKGQDDIKTICKITTTLTTSENQRNNIYNNMTRIDLGECEILLRNFYNISINETLYINKIDIIQDGMKTVKVKYNVYAKLNGKKLIKLNLTICEKSKISILIPYVITDSLDKYNTSTIFYFLVPLPY